MKLWKLTVVLNYYEAMETYSRIELLQDHMDSEGWISVDCIMTFPRIKLMTDLREEVIKSLLTSSTLEMSGEQDKIRAREYVLHSKRV